MKGEVLLRKVKVIRIGGEFYRLKYQDPGILRPEDRGLWRADKVEWDGDHWGYHDDDDFLIDAEARRVVAREVGWDLRRIDMRTS